MQEKRRVMVLGATGTVGQATVHALLRHGLDVTCFVRPNAGVGGKLTAAETAQLLEGAALRFGDVANAISLQQDGFRGEQFDVLISCLASRSGDPEEAWAIDHKAHVTALECAKRAGIRQMVLLSAICVQKPKLAFQHAKLAFEKELIASGLTYSIVRPTALFKSLSGQIERVKKGKPFLVFGNGTLTACKPISDHDLAEYMVRCVDDPDLHNRILPIGGPGEAITPLQQGKALFELVGQRPRFRHVPVALLDGIIVGLSLLARLRPSLAKKAEFARIGRYYATESMLVFDPATGTYQAQQTPSTGSETLFDFYKEQVTGVARIQLGDHAVFSE
jgi:divinyl chlorophyllide a 8-vinyl-reductase